MTYDHSIKIPLTLTSTYGVTPENICNNHIYNGCGLVNRDNALNRVQDPLEACAIAGCLN